MNNQKEIWKPIFTETINKELGMLDGVFLVSNKGRVKNGLTDKIVTPSLWGDYYSATLSHSKKFLNNLSACMVELNKRRKLNGIK